MEVIQGIPQGSVLDPLLFNILVYDIFLIVEKSDNCNFVGDNTIYSYDSNFPKQCGESSYLAQS